MSRERDRERERERERVYYFDSQHYNAYRGFGIMSLANARQRWPPTTTHKPIMTE